MRVITILIVLFIVGCDKSQSEFINGCYEAKIIYQGDEITQTLCRTGLNQVGISTRHENNLESRPPSTCVQNGIIEYIRGDDFKVVGSTGSCDDGQTQHKHLLSCINSGPESFSCQETQVNITIKFNKTEKSVGSPNEFVDLFPGSEFKLVSREEDVDEMGVDEMTLEKNCPPIHADKIVDVRMSRDGQALVTASRDHIVKVWDASSYKLKSTTELPVARFSKYFDISEDGKKILLVEEETDNVSIRDIASGAVVSEFVRKLEKNEPAPEIVRLSPSGKFVVVISYYKSPRLWSVADSKLLHVFPECVEYCNAVFDPQEKFIAVLDRDGVIKYDLITLKALNQTKKSNYHARSLAIHPDGDLLAEGNEHSLLLWNASDLSFFREGDGGHRRSIKKIEFSPDGKFIISSDGYRLTIWRSPNKNPGSAIYRTPDIGPARFTFSSDGKKIFLVLHQSQQSLYSMAFPDGKELTCIGSQSD